MLWALIRSSYWHSFFILWHISALLMNWMKTVIMISTVSPGPNCAVIHLLIDLRSQLIILMLNLPLCVSNVWSQPWMVHDGSTDILAVKNLLLSFARHIHTYLNTLVHHCYRDDSAYVPDMIFTVTGRTTIAKERRKKGRNIWGSLGRRSKPHHTEMFSK